MDPLTFVKEAEAMGADSNCLDQQAGMGHVSAHSRAGRCQFLMSQDSLNSSYGEIVMF
ncbi:MAG: hypothetical protein QM498_10315 [Desulfobacterium sp.]